MTGQMTRYERLCAAFNLEKADRVPVTPMMLYVVPYWAGMSIKEAKLDPEKTIQAYIKYQDYLGDGTHPLQTLHDHLGLLGRTAWDQVTLDWRVFDEFPPKGNVPNLWEKEVIEDYDDLMERGFSTIMFNKKLQNGIFERSIEDFLYFEFEYLEVWGKAWRKFYEQTGIPLWLGGRACHPLDMLQYYRGIYNLTSDLYEQPEKVRAVCEWLAEYEAVRAMYRAKIMGAGEVPGAETILFINGGPPGLSPRFHDEFYFPYAKQMIDIWVTHGFIVWCHWDTNLNPHLKTMSHLVDGLPKGYVLMDLEKVDMKLAKQVLGDKMCLYGNVPSAMLVYGTLEEVDKYCKKLIEDCAEGGGFILGTGERRQGGGGHRRRRHPQHRKVDPVHPAGGGRFRSHRPGDRRAGSALCTGRATEPTRYPGHVGPAHHHCHGAEKCDRSAPGSQSTRCGEGDRGRRGDQRSVCRQDRCRRLRPHGAGRGAPVSQPAKSLKEIKGMIKGFTRTNKPLELLSEQGMESIHRGALYVLDKSGMRVEHERALRLFAEHGCRVDFELKRVRFPASLVEECLRSCPSSYTIRARDPDLDLVVGGDTVYFMQGMGMRYVDLETWETRPATAEEHRQAMIVADALENVHLADGIFFYMERQGVPPVMVMLENLVSGLRNCAKAEQFGYQRDCDIFAIQIAKALGINLNPELDSAGPLTIYGGAVEAAFRYVEADIPIQPTVNIGLGTEGPATHAGAMVLGLAMIMAWTTLTQLIKPGAAMSIQHGLIPTDMKRGTRHFGGVGRAITTIMTNQLLRRYRIPSCPGLGFTSDSKKIDFQAGYEKALGALVSALSGGNLQIFQGGSCAELLYHPVLSILDDDIAGWIGRLLEGTTVDDETLAIDLINQVGPIPGHYLNTEHTRKHWRAADYIPKVGDMESYPVWIKSGKKDALALARERMEQLLDTHKPRPLTSAEEQAIEDILKEARAYYRQKGWISDQEWSEYMQAISLAS